MFHIYLVHFHLVDFDGVVETYDRVTRFCNSVPF
jgi:hypothetical protein